ncbi:MAG TPA: patatin-like protein, partial [Egibacteraceae bacterium]|nr:patatin-like protein [Egibacteraceae bacterium]
MGDDMRSLREQVRPDDREQLRIALVMSGGSSLAIWIGGVSAEVHRLTQTAPGDATGYGALLDITRSEARMDVIAGTSAGGLNGAFLALAAARTADLSPLAELWATRGAASELLRPALEADPPSLLRGDGYFLPELRRALQGIWDAGRRYVPPDVMPLHLIMTTTVLAGVPKTFVDDFGNRLHEVEHRATFEFLRDARTVPAGEPVDARSRARRDPFGDPAVVGRLALAARSTASFPGAFEPSFVPIGAGHDELHPDMSQVIDLAASGFVLDGGVLVNRPVDLALRAVFRQPAAAQVRRALIFVEPDPAGELALEPDRYDRPPSLRQVMVDSLTTLPRAQSVAGALESLLEHNQRVRERRAVRLRLGGSPDGATAGDAPAADVADLAGALFPRYVEQRREAALRTVFALARHDHLLGVGVLPGGVPAWSELEFAAAFRRARELPFVPDSMGDDPAERWGVDFAEHLAYLAVDVLRRAIWLVPADQSDLRRRVRERRAELHETLRSLHGLREEDRRFWQVLLAELLPPPASAS